MLSFREKLMNSGSMRKLQAWLPVLTVILTLLAGGVYVSYSHRACS